MLNRELSRALTHLRVRAADGGFDRGGAQGGELDGLLWPVVRRYHRARGGA